jgi:hypothetical protein
VSRNIGQPSTVGLYEFVRKYSVVTVTYPIIDLGFEYNIDNQLAGIEHSGTIVFYSTVACGDQNPLLVNLDRCCSGLYI